MPNSSFIEPELQKFLGAYGWEKHLEPYQLRALALYRSFLKPEDEDTFAFSWARITGSWDFHSDLQEAEEDNDRVMRANIFYEAELESYPYSLGEPA